MKSPVVRSLSLAKLPACDPGTVACREALRGRMAPRPVRVAGGDYHLEWQGHDARLRSGFEVAVRIGPWRFALQVETAAGGFAPLGMDVGAMPPVVARTLVAEFFGDATRAIEQHSGVRLEVDGVWTERDAAAPGAPDVLPRGIGLVLREQASGLCMRAAVFPQDDDSFTGLAQLCAGWPWRATGPEPWPLRCRLMLGSTTLAAWELGQLEAADVLFIEHPPPGDGRVRAALFFGNGETSAFLAQVQDREVSIVDDNPFHQVMVEEDIAQDRDTTLLDRLEVTVRFWIGGRRFAWREIQALQAGSVLTLDHNLADAEVLMVVDGQRVGRGTLVAVGEKLGVRIASIAPSQKPAPAHIQAPPRAPRNEPPTLS